MAFVCLIALAAPLAVAQTADPGGSGTPAPPSTQPSYSPLTGDERLHRYVQSMVGPMSWVTGAFSAGFGQLRNRPEEWGQGARGFGLRMGSGFATRVTRETIGYGVAGLLHEDNRFFRSEETTTGGRLKDAILGTFTARHDDGTQHVSVSKFSSWFGSAMISRTWQPPSTGAVSSGFQNFGTQIGVAMGFNVVKEFLPKKLRFIK